MEQVDWDIICDASDIDDSYNAFIEKLKTVQDKHIPKVMIKPQSDFKQPWFNHELLQLRKEKTRLYKKLKTKPDSQIIKDRYKSLRNLFLSRMRTAERNYYARLIEDASGDQKKTWRVLNEIIGRNNKKCTFPDKLNNSKNELLTEPKEIADEMNHFFSNIGLTLAKDILDPGIDPMAFVTANRSAESLSIPPLIPHDVYKRLRKLKQTKPCGADEIHPRFVRDTADVITVESLSIA